MHSERIVNTLEKILEEYKTKSYKKLIIAIIILVIFTLFKIFRKKSKTYRKNQKQTNLPNKFHIKKK